MLAYGPDRDPCAAGEEVGRLSRAAAGYAARMRCPRTSGRVVISRAGSARWVGTPARTLPTIGRSLTTSGQKRPISSIELGSSCALHTGTYLQPWLECLRRSRREVSASSTTRYSERVDDAPRAESPLVAAFPRLLPSGLDVSMTCSKRAPLLTDLVLVQARDSGTSRTVAGRCIRRVGAAGWQIAGRAECAIGLRCET